jgi:hypothetical protein
MGGLPQALEIILEVQRKKSNKKITRRKINFFNLQNPFFFFFLVSSLWTPLSLSNF